MHEDCENFIEKFLLFKVMEERHQVLRTMSKIVEDAQIVVG
jgi:hypothetical protein